MSTSVKSIMATKLITLPTGSTLLAAQQLMEEKRIRHLAIVSQAGEIVGVISQKDLADGNNFAVEKVMWPVEFVDQDLSLRNAIFKMLELKISCLLVTDEKNNALGIVTTDDLLMYLAQLLPEETHESSNRYMTFKAKTLQTVGEIANELTSMGI